MEKLSPLGEFLATLRDGGLVTGHLRGVFHLAIGRRISDAAGTLVSAGVTWRELSVLLRDLRFDKNLVTEVGADPDELAPRDRQRFWYSAIALARPDSAEARAEAEVVIEMLKPLGYAVGPVPAPVTPKSLSSPVTPPAAEGDGDDEPPPKGRRGR